MDSFEFNKIAAAVLVTALLFIGIKELGNFVYHVDKPKKSAYKIEGVAENSVAAKKEIKIEEKLAPIKPLLASASIEAGAKVFKKCAACHSIVKGGKNAIGPALYNVVGRKVGGVEDYKYSKALAAYDKEWTFEELNGFLKKPAKYIKGTKMAYAGLRKESDRASVIKYLNENSDNPLPLP